jgi:hypothetical protein
MMMIVAMMSIVSGMKMTMMMIDVRMTEAA